MSIPTACARQSRFHNSARPLPQPRSTTRSAGPGREELAQHVVADLRSEQRRRHALVARVGVQRLVQVFRPLLEGLVRPQVEKVRRRPAVLLAARLAGQRRRFTGERPVAGRAADEREQSVAKSRRPSPSTRRANSASSRSARRAHVNCAHVRSRLRRQPLAQRRVVLDPLDPGDQRLRVARLHQQRVLLVPQDFAQRRQVARDDRPSRRHVFEQLQAAT